jgi:hypothetical protein
MTNYICITGEREGFHNWPDANKEVRYLSHKHWHIFKFKIGIEIFGNDREIEFHMFRNYVFGGFINRWPKNLRNKSCEMLANQIYEHITKKYKDRKAFIEVSEDGINSVHMEYLKKGE